MIMTLPILSLTMSKITKSQQKLHLRQSERGLILTAELCDYNGSPYNLTGLSVRFKDAKAGGKSVSDDNVTIATDPKTGIITYPLHSQVFAENGIGWFEVYSNSVTLIDSTQNIPIVIEKDISGTIDNSDYVSGVSGIKAQLQGIVDSAKQILDNAVSGANTAASNANKAAQAAQALANDIPNNPKYRGPVGQTGPQGGKGDKGNTGDTGPTGPQGERGNQIYKSSFEDIPNGTGYYWSDLSPAPSVDNPPKIGDTIITPSGNIFQIASVHVGSADGYGSSFAVGPVLGNIKGPAGKDGKDGTGIQLKGSADSADKLPPTGNTSGDTYLVKGHLYIWQHGAWQDAGQLQGPKGDDGRSAYQVWLDAGHKGSESDYLASLKGATGAPGTKGDTGNTGPAGPDGKSAYQVWLAAGHRGSESDYLASLKGATGPAGKDGAPGTPGKDGATPDLAPYLKTADADKKYQTATQVQAVVDAKVVPVPDEATATRSSTTNTTALYLVPEAS